MIYLRNHVIDNYPGEHWTYHIIGYLIDALTNDKVTYGVILHSFVFRNILHDKYSILVRRKELLAIEDIDITWKLNYWKESGNYTEDRNSRIELSKHIYTLDHIANKYYTQ